MVKLVSSDDSCAAAVWIQLNLHTVTDKHFNPMQTHLSSQVSKRQLVVMLYPKERVWKRLFDDSFYDFGFRHICVLKNSKIEA